ncbi:hypothetical protein [Winogradskyella sp. Asnod2-B02-A]|uniref:hypothetical protein n=1 Tax=Winogradskyella sp. Asnod2-B02-A TaxID=3160583 RepID=UPI003867AAA1
MSLRILILILSFVFISSCKDQPKETSEIVEIEEIPNINSKKLNGTWELVSFYNYKDNVVVDSFDTSSTSRQLKMYTDSKVMWCKHKPADSSEWFGYGTYNFKDNTLTEVLDFGSAVMDNVISEKKQFKFELQLQSNQFQQIELDDDGNRIYSENYKRVE